MVTLLPVGAARGSEVVHVGDVAVQEMESSPDDFDEVLVREVHLCMSICMGMCMGMCMCMGTYARGRWVAVA